ncbi:MAG: RNA-binding S4 domain-containing protein [Actinomyces sp.]|nr:RNA-binding S4 domain-containing protein [Actinomyces sp.]
MRTVEVRGSIRLGQFLKLAGLADDGALARQLVTEGDVSINGVPELRRGHHLQDGDVVEVDAPAGRDGALVRVLPD